MLYDITAHPLLSEQAAELGATELEAHARVAEVLLGFTDFTAFDAVTQEDEYDRATDAVALQVSYQVECGVEAFVLASTIRGARRKTFRGGYRRMPVVHSQAKRIASKLAPDPVRQSR